MCSFNETLLHRYRLQKVNLENVFVSVNILKANISRSPWSRELMIYTYIQVYFYTMVIFDVFGRIPPRKRNGLNLKIKRNKREKRENASRSGKYKKKRHRKRHRSTTMFDSKVTRVLNSWEISRSLFFLQRFFLFRTAKKSNGKKLDIDQKIK